MTKQPYTPILDLDAIETKQVVWNGRDAAGNSYTCDSKINVSEVYDSFVNYPMSFIACEHPQGKSWESLFIPMAATGVFGVSVTWYNRNVGLKGSINVKITSELDFYNTVASKAVYKGYGVSQFVGRSEGLNRRHAFVENLHKSEASVAHTAGLSVASVRKMTPREVGSAYGAALLQIPPLALFVHKLRELGHISDAIGQMENLSASVTDAGKRLLFRAVLDTLEANMSMLGVKVKETEPQAKAPTPTPSHAPAYESWGAFG